MLKRIEIIIQTAFHSIHMLVLCHHHSCKHAGDEGIYYNEIVNHITLVNNLAQKLVVLF